MIPDEYRLAAEQIVSSTAAFAVHLKIERGLSSGDYDQRTTDFFIRAYHRSPLKDVPLLCEGRRDGVRFLRSVAKSSGMAMPMMIAIADPIDGTRNFLKGSAGSAAVLGLRLLESKSDPLLVLWRNGLSDRTALFFAASHTGTRCPSFLAELRRIQAEAKKFPRRRLGFLNRVDNLEMVKKVRSGRFRRSGAGGYRPDIRNGATYGVGDCSINLAFISDLAFGRVGSIEALIEMSLWKHWCAVIVNKEKMQAFEQGAEDYIVTYINDLEKNGLKNLAKYLEADEIKAVAALLRRTGSYLIAPPPKHFCFWTVIAALSRFPKFAKAKRGGIRSQRIVRGACQRCEISLLAVYPKSRVIGSEVARKLVIINEHY